MDGLFKLLEPEQWKVIYQAPVPFATTAIFLLIFLGLLFKLWYAQVLRNKDSQLELQDRQLSDYKNKLEGASPDQAKAKVDDLHDQLMKLKRQVEPRYLTADQRDILSKTARPPIGTFFELQICSEMTCHACTSYATDFSTAIGSLGGWRISQPNFAGISNKSPGGLALIVRDQSNLSLSEALVARSLDAASVPFEIIKNRLPSNQRSRDGETMLMVSARIMPA